MMLGDWDMDEIANVDEELAYSFFITYVFICGIFLLNIFLAIVMEAYEHLGGSPALVDCSAFTIMRDELRYFSLTLKGGGLAQHVKSLVAGDEMLKPENGDARGNTLCDRARVLRHLHRAMPGNSAFISVQVRNAVRAVVRTEATIDLIEGEPDDDPAERDSIAAADLEKAPFGLTRAQASALLLECRAKLPAPDAPAAADPRIPELEKKLDETLALVRVLAAQLAKDRNSTELETVDLSPGVNTY